MERCNQISIIILRGDAYTNKVAGVKNFLELCFDAIFVKIKISS